MAILPKPVAVLAKPASFDGRFINNGRFVKAEDQASGRNGRFINQKRPNGQTSLSAARPSNFYKWPAKRMAALSRPASRSGRFIKADVRFIKAG